MTKIETDITGGIVMKKLIAILVMAVLVVISTSAFGVEITITSPNGEQKKTTEPAFTTTQPTISSTDFSNCTWGMTFDDVKAAEGEHEWSSPDAGVMVYSGHVADLDVIMCFFFDTNDTLYKGTIMTNEKHTNDNLYISDYNKLKEALTLKYGNPNTDKTIWLNDLFKGDTSGYGLAVSIGHLVYKSTWETERTDIVMVLGGDNYDIAHAIVYTDKNHVEVSNTTGL